MARAKGPRTERFNMFLAPEERIMLDQLAAAAGGDASTYLRGLIRREAAKTLDNVLNFIKPASSPHKTKAAVNRAIRGEKLDEIVRFAEVLDTAVPLWRSGDREAAIELVVAAERATTVIGTQKDWSSTLETHASLEPGKRATSAHWTTNQIVLALLDVDSFGKLDDGKSIVDVGSVKTRLGKRRGRRLRSMVDD